MSRRLHANASATTKRWYMQNALATRNVTAAALRRTKLVSGSAIATKAPTSVTVKMGRRSNSAPRIQRPRYIWPRPGRRRDRTAAKLCEPLIGADSKRARGGRAAEAAPRFDTEPLAYEPRPPTNRVSASGRLRNAAGR